jgi:hypothetical protein
MNWRHSFGPMSNINALDNHEVVHVACRSAKWAGKELPTDAEWGGILVHVGQKLSSDSFTINPPNV